MTPLPIYPVEELRNHFGSRLQEQTSMANYTTMRVGGPADLLVVAQSADEIEDAARAFAQHGVPYKILGNGSNVLVSDRGVRGAVIINRAHNIRIDVHSNPPTVYAESGANLGGVARQVALRGLSGMEWAAVIPGSIGGAVYGNAGAMGSDMAHTLVLAEILHPNLVREIWSCERLEYSYRSSVLKRNPGQEVILAARLALSFSSPAEVQEKMESFSAKRRGTQPPGASCGSTFKNPTGDYAGRLIEAAGLKGTRIGGVMFSPMHGNFIINDGKGTASEVFQLIQLARTKVKEDFGVQLELEIELMGDWSEELRSK